MTNSPASPTVQSQPSSISARIAHSWLGATAALFLVASAGAQQVIMSTPDQPLIAPIMRPPADVVPAATDFLGFPTGPSIAAGGFRLEPHLVVSYVRANGLPAAGSTRVTSNILTFSPGLLVDLGPHWTTDYTATAHNYSDPTLRNTVDHDIRIVGANRAPDLNLQLSESYSVTSSILVETALQTKQKTWSNSLTADHQFGNLLHYQGTFGLTETNTENYSNVRDWSTDQWLRAAVSPKVDAGIGVSFGYSDIVARPNTYNQRYLGEFNWRPTDKLNLALQGGWEDFHSLSAAVGSERTPILQATLGWQPAEQTGFTFTDSRSVSNSVLGDGTIKSDNWSISMHQRLAGKLLLNLGYNHASTSYSSGVGTAIFGRADAVKSFNSSLSVLVFKYWSVAATYQKSKNDSNLAAYTFSSSQYGLELRGRF